MVASQSRLAIDVWDEFTGWMSRAYTLDADEHNLDRLRELGESHTLVFLPSHRSYLDPMVLRHTARRARLPAQPHPRRRSTWPFWPIGPIGRRVGR